MRSVISYDSKLKFLARKNRKKSTLAEAMLWTKLRRRQIFGYIFLRQKPVHEYIVDFYCPDLKLAIEIDGSSHELKDISDEKRQMILEGMDIRFIRFANSEILSNIDGAPIVIKKWI